MLTLEDKDHIITGIYHAKEAMFFFLGVGTLLVIPALNADLAQTIQLCVIGTVLVLEGFAFIAEVGMNFILNRAIPWVERRKRKKNI